MASKRKTPRRRSPARKKGMNLVPVAGGAVSGALGGGLVGDGAAMAIGVWQGDDTLQGIAGYSIGRNVVAPMVGGILSPAGTTNGGWL